MSVITEAGDVRWPSIEWNQTKEQDRTRMAPLTREYLLARGTCCGHGCRNCPYTEEIMTHPSKRKGNAYERELVNQAKDSGLEAKRAWASNGRSLGLHEEVDLVVGDKRIQAKRRKSIASFLLPNENVDAVAFRPDAGETMVLLTWWEYLDLVKGCQINKDGNDDAIQSVYVHTRADA